MNFSLFSRQKKKTRVLQNLKKKTNGQMNLTTWEGLPCTELK